MSWIHDKDILLNLLSLVCSAAITAFTIKSLIGFYIPGNRGMVEPAGKRAYKYFTVQSNILMAVTAAMMLVFNVLILLDPSKEAPLWMLAVKHVGTVSVLLTFSVVFFIFVPGTGLHAMIAGDDLFLHLVLPLIALVSIVFFDRGPKLPLWCIPLGMIPMLLYAVLYFVMVMKRGPENGGWEDFYRFNAGGRWYVSAAVIFAMTALLGLLLCLGRNVFAAGILA